MEKQKEVRKMKTKAALLLFLMFFASIIATTAVAISASAPNISVSQTSTTNIASSYVQPLGDPIDDDFFPM